MTVGRRIVCHALAFTVLAATVGARATGRGVVDRKASPEQHAVMIVVLIVLAPALLWMLVTAVRMLLAPPPSSSTISARTAANGYLTGEGDACMTVQWFVHLPVHSVSACPSILAGALRSP
jgi:hypothetical protein